MLADKLAISSTIEPQREHWFNKKKLKHNVSVQNVMHTHESTASSQKNELSFWSPRNNSFINGL